LITITIEVTGKVFWSEAEENLARLSDGLFFHFRKPFQPNLFLSFNFLKARIQ